MEQTADQIRALANLFANMSSTVDDYRSQHFTELDASERLRLEQLFQQLCDLRDQLTALAIQNTLDAVASDLNQVVTLTAQAKQALAHLQTTAEIANLVAAAAGLGADISTADYGAIPEDIEQLIQALQKKSDQ